LTIYEITSRGRKWRKRRWNGK